MSDKWSHWHEQTPSITPDMLQFDPEDLLDVGEKAVGGKLTHLVPEQHNVHSELHLASHVQ